MRRNLSRFILRTPSRGVNEPKVIRCGCGCELARPMVAETIDCLSGQYQTFTIAGYPPIDSLVRPRYAGLQMVGNRPVVGVRNPVGSSFCFRYPRAKTRSASRGGLSRFGIWPTERGGRLFILPLAVALPHTTLPCKRHLNHAAKVKSEPSLAAGGGITKPSQA
jgi:hypothetical protein